MRFPYEETTKRPGKQATQNFPTVAEAVQLLFVSDLLFLKAVLSSEACHRTHNSKQLWSAFGCRVRGSNAIRLQTHQVPLAHPGILLNLKRGYSWNVVSGGICTFMGVRIGTAWNAMVSFYALWQTQTQIGLTGFRMPNQKRGESVPMRRTCISAEPPPLERCPLAETLNSEREGAFE